MARHVHGQTLLRPLLLAVCCLLLLHVSECSRPSPSPAADHDDHALHHHKLLLMLHAGPPTSMKEVAGDGGRRTAAATVPSPALAVGAVANSRSRQTTSDRVLLVPAGMLRPQVLMLLRSKLARRFLAGAGAVDEAAGSATDGSGASCHSYNPHINCPPASKP